MSNKKAKFNVISPEFAEKLMTEYSDEIVSLVKDVESGDVRFTFDRNSKFGRQVMLGQIGGAGRSYELTDFLTLSHEDFMTLWSIAVDYYETKNIYFAFQAFRIFISSRRSPPAWVLDAINEGIGKHLLDPNPKKFAKQMSVAGSASGATNPYEEFKKRKGRVKAMFDIYALVRIFKGRKLSKRKAAEAVKIKYGLSETAKYLAEHYTKRWMHLCDSVCHPNLHDDTVWQTKFKTSFPLKARKLFPS